MCSVLKKQGLQAPADFVHKTVQLHETLGVRFGAMVVGPTGTGKSTLLRTLQVSFCATLASTLLVMRQCRLVSTHSLWQHEWKPAVHCLALSSHTSLLIHAL